MKHQSIVPSLRFRSIRLITTSIALGSIAPVFAQGATYSAVFFPIGSDVGTSTDKTSTGFTDPLQSPSGSVDITATGLMLDYSVLGSTGTETEYSVITNVADITGSGIQLDRYLSFQLGPDNFDALAGYSGSYTVEIDGFFRTLRTDVGEHFEIRTSLDGFASPLAQWNNPGTDRASFLAPGLSPGTAPTVTATDGVFVSTDAPIEFRFYTWYDSAGGDGIVGWDPNLGGGTGWRLNYTVTTVPEPSAALLLGAAGSLAFLRRRRA